MSARGLPRCLGADHELQLPHEEFTRLRRRWNALLGALKEARREAQEHKSDARSAREEVEDANAEIARLQEVLRQQQAAYERVRRELIQTSGDAAYYRALAEERSREPGSAPQAPARLAAPTDEPEGGWREFATRLLTVLANPPPGAAATAAAAVRPRAPSAGSRYPRPPSSVPAATEVPRSARGRTTGGTGSRSPVWRQRHSDAQAEAQAAAQEEARRWRRLAEQRGEELSLLRKARVQDAPEKPGSEASSNAEAAAPAEGKREWSPAVESTDDGAASSTCSPGINVALGPIFASPTPARSRLARFQIMKGEPGANVKAGKAHRGLPLTQYFDIASPEKQECEKRLAFTAWLDLEADSLQNTPLRCSDDSIATSSTPSSV